MKISIITVNLNNKAGLEATMDSVLCQTFTDFEYIIIDGGSTDGSTTVINHHSQRLAYWSSEPDRGVYHAMNKGIEQARGEYLLFLNSGDRLLSHDTLFEASVYLEGEGLVYGKLRYDRGDHFVDAEYPDKLSLSYLYVHYIPHPATFISRELFNRVGLYEEKYKICADWVFFVRSIAFHDASYRHINQVITIYDTQGVSAKPENFSMISQERNQMLDEAFPLYVEDLRAYINLRKEVEKLKRGKWAKLLNWLGVLKNI